MVNNVCGWFPYRVMQRSGVVERVLGKKPTNAKDRVCVARPDLAPAASPPSFVSHVLRGLVWGGVRWGWSMVPLSTRICARTVIGSGDDAMPGEGLFFSPSRHLNWW